MLADGQRPRLTRYLFANPIENRTMVLVNCLSGAIDVVSGMIADVLLEADAHPERLLCTGDLPAWLWQRGYICSEDEERRMLDRTRSAFLRAPTPLRLYVSTTYSCNSRCTYCSQWDIPVRDATTSMSTDQASAALDAIANLLSSSGFGPDAKARYRVINLYGGEPLQPHLLGVTERIYEQCQRTGIRVACITNGVDAAEFLPLFERCRNATAAFLLTLDGPREVHDARRACCDGRSGFDSTVAAVDALLEHGFHCNVQTNLDRDNLAYLPSMAELYDRRGWTDCERFSASLQKVIFPKCAAPTGYGGMLGEEEFIVELEALLDSHPELSCFSTNIAELDTYSHLRRAVVSEARFSMPMVAGCDSARGRTHCFCPDGLVYGCVETVGVPALATGSYYPVAEQFASTVERWQVRSPLTQPRCLSCKYLTICGGACPLQWILSGQSETDPPCPDVEGVIRAFLRAHKSQLLRDAAAADQART